MDSPFKFEDTFVVEEPYILFRLDRLIQEVTKNSAYPVSRSKACELIELNLVQVNQKKMKAAYKVKAGDIVSLKIPKAPSGSLKASHLPVKILFEDSACVVVSKPPGLVVHPGAGHAQDTLVNALLDKVSALSVGAIEKRPGIVHRLDKDTSGILVVAKTNHALTSLSAQFKAKSVHRIYHALVYGRPKESSGKVESFLERHPVHRKKFHSGTKGKRAVTHFKVLASARGLSLIQCQLETGRTHQIRVHLSEMNCPIVGDPIYSTPRRMKDLGQEIKNAIKSMNGIGLHAFELGFSHPDTGEKMFFKEPWPDHLLALVHMLGFENV